MPSLNLPTNNLNPSLGLSVVDFISVYHRCIAVPPAFSPAHTLAATLRLGSPALNSSASASSPAIRSAAPILAPSTSSLPNPVTPTPTLTRSPVPSVLSFTSGRHFATARALHSPA
ncbi:unnamed protein product [Rhizoctonia solani]|nr:unnamed protein product [Rhizoctonia solani]